jgi:hypothetical protein
MGAFTKARLKMKKGYKIPPLSERMEQLFQPRMFDLILRETGEKQLKRGMIDESHSPVLQQIMLDNLAKRLNIPKITEEISHGSAHPQMVGTAFSNFLSSSASLSVILGLEEKYKEEVNPLKKDLIELNKKNREMLVLVTKLSEEAANTPKSRAIREQIKKAHEEEVRQAEELSKKSQEMMKEAIEKNQVNKDQVPEEWLEALGIIKKSAHKASTSPEMYG